MVYYVMLGRFIKFMRKLTLWHQASATTLSIGMIMEQYRIALGLKPDQIVLEYFNSGTVYKRKIMCDVV